MKYFSIACIVLVGIFCSCSTRKDQNDMVIGEQYYLSNSQKMALSKKVQEGDACAAYKLAEHEEFFGDYDMAIYWYKKAASLGDERAKETLRSLQSIRKGSK